MPRAKEIKIRVEDRPGILGEVALALSEKKVNLRAVNAWVENGEGVIRMVVDNVGAAKRALADKPGALAALATALGEAGVNITHVFVGTAGARKATVFLGVSDLKAGLKAAR